VEKLHFQNSVKDELAMMSLAERLAKACEKGVIIFLYGPLGAGKTTFSRGFLRGLGYAGKVKSPTYTLVEPYETKKGSLFHFDFYRIREPQELEFMGIQDYFFSQAMCLIEWPEMAKSLLPQADISCYIAMHEEGREIKLEAGSVHGQNILKRLQDDHSI
jgi:tRNA threonylcarbamoyladenosine biosynthesis protein TsaE